MDWKTFFVNIIDAVAWPILIWMLIYKFKSELMSFFYRIKKIKYKDNEIELFEKELEELEETSSHNVKLSNIDENMNEKYNFLIKLANISPRSAIIESFIVLESAINKTIAKLDLPLDKYKRKSPMHNIEILKENNIITKEQYYQLQKLRALRNQASHLEDFELKDMPIEAYIDIALTLANSIEKMSNKT